MPLEHVRIVRPVAKPLAVGRSVKVRDQLPRGEAENTRGQRSAELSNSARTVLLVQRQERGFDRIVCVRVCACVWVCVLRVGHHHDALLGSKRCHLVLCVDPCNAEWLSGTFETGSISANHLRRCASDTKGSREIATLCACVCACLA